ncbi:small VCP/p97-interacting protein [Manacus vitellinus]|uniref:small VCP/p97-interacting protein n=1 Tax=Manacus vitellinus TaxID=328815 RepID=UPI00115E4EB9|nr:small VCP/p97-interacting protein [Manacus vitellinus]
MLQHSNSGNVVEQEGLGLSPQCVVVLASTCPAPGGVGCRWEIKRRQLAEAAEKRQMEASSRGIKNAYSVEQKKKKQEEIEKRMAASRPGGEGGLRWQVG